MKLKTFSVSQVNRYISSYLSANPILINIKVCGEVSGLKKISSDCTFFSLKDENSRISAMTFLKDFQVQEGDFITVSCKLNFHEKNGNCTLIVKEYEKTGLGHNYEKFKLLYEDLEKLGYFKEENKKPIAKYPEVIGIITSAKGAAIQDIIAIISRRYPKLKLLIYDTKVQGEKVEQGVIQGIEIFNDMRVDTIIISRGGGDSDDLSVFNSRLIAQSIFSSYVPIISAIGHEIDTLITDFVSDKRASTPTMAGELATPDLANILEFLDNFDKNLNISYKNIINKYNLKLKSYSLNIQSNTPYKKLNEKKSFVIQALGDMKLSYKLKLEQVCDKLDNYEQEIQISYINILNQYKNKLSLYSDIIHSNTMYKKLSGKKIILLESINKINTSYKSKIFEYKNKLFQISLILQENNKNKIMEKGFAMVEKDGILIKSVSSLKLGDNLILKLKDGKVKIKVEQIY